MMTSSNGNIFRVTGPLCGEFTGPGEFPTQRPVTRSFDVFFDLRLNKRLSKEPWGWWFETPSWSLWRHCNGLWRHHCLCPGLRFGGTAMDYAKGVVGVKYAYAPELRKSGEGVLIRTPADITICSEETWAAIEGMLREVHRLAHLPPTPQPGHQLHSRLTEPEWTALMNELDLVDTNDAAVPVGT